MSHQRAVDTVVAAWLTSVAMAEPTATRTPARTRADHRRRQLVTALLFVGFVAAVGFVYVFIASAGHLTSWRTWTAYYDPQAEGFRAGHLYTTVPVSPQLKSLKDPLNPANMHFWRWDYSYYQGHIYIYWGLLPAAMLAALKVAFGIQRLVTDDPVVFAFLLAQAVAGSLLIRAMARRLTPGPPSWAVWLAMAVFALGHPAPYLLARAAIYEAAIVAGSCFMVLAFYAAFEGILAERPRRGVWLLALASLCTGLAGASRVSLLPAAVVTTTVATLARWQSDGRGWRRLAWLAPLLAAPLTLVTLTQMLLNHLRFGASTEFGQKYQMGFQFLPFGARFFLADAYVYLFRSPTRWCKFPFISAEWGYPADLFPRWLPVPSEYRVTEPTVGLFLVAPFFWFLLALPLAAWLRARRRAGEDAPAFGDDATAARWRWFLSMLAADALATAAIPWLIGTATMRYQADFAPPILLLATVGAWRWLGTFRRRRARVSAAAVYVVLALLTIGAGGLMGFTGYFNHFQRHNPELLHALKRRLHVCHGP